ncbi:MAG: hypothetical protein H6706_28740 [Myxococcales bacterium]|nr:hypothetical protein [Myxococcales bacterium]
MRAALLLALLPGVALGAGPVPDPALVELTAAADAGDAEALLQLAQVEARRGDLRAALARTHRALAAGIHPLRVNLVRGDAYAAAGEYAEAVREYFEVVLAAPANGHAHVQLWLALREAQLPPSMDGARVRQVLRAAGYVIADAPRRPRQPAEAARLEAEGFELLAAGQFTTAIERFEAAVAADDTRAQPFRGLGIAQGRLGQKAASVAAWRLYLALTDRDDRERRQVERVILDAERRRGLSGEMEAE